VILMKCSFCGKEIRPGTGLIFIKKDGSRLDFCTRKCERNTALGRKSRKIRWTEEFRRFKGKGGKND
jgi:large subunit ribosomal protein L24e